jgi:glycosyltransferase involved in cell wall biosynthesis
VGNLHDFKRVDLILQALMLVRQTRPDTTLLIVGNGPARTGLENLTTELGLEKAVTFLGWSDDIPGCLRRSRILLLLSDHEGLPAAVIEALCSGLPVIATNVGAVSSVVHDGANGFLLQTLPNPSQVSQCLLPLLTDKDTYQRMSNNALTTRETHGYEASAQAWKTILDSVNLR